MRRKQRTVWLAVLATWAVAAAVLATSPGRCADQAAKPEAKLGTTAAPAAEVSDAQMQELVRRMEAEQKAELQRLKTDPAWKPSCEQVSVIRPCPELKGEALHNFCLDRQGRILAGVGGQRWEWEVDAKTQEPRSKLIDDPAEIRVFGPDGKRLTAWKLEVTPQALCVQADGTIYVAGMGRIAKLSPNGKLLAAVDTPPVDELKQKQRKAEEAAKAKEKAATPDGEKAAAKPAKSGGLFGALVNAVLGGGGPSAEQQAATEKQMEEYRRQQVREVTGIAVTDRDLFVCCGMSEGYGFTVWRLNHDLNGATPVVKQLRGCCGQMDIQAAGDELWIPVNGEHKVKRFDRDGKLLGTFGKHDRTAADGFGGCCEPKNLRVAADGTVYTAESGPPVVVKHFTAEGKFLGVAGLPEFKVGCVRVTVAVSPDAAKIYVLNTGENAIHVLADARAIPTHELLTHIQPEGPLTLNNFCLDAADRLLLARGAAGAARAQSAAGQEAKAAAERGEVVELSPEGRALKRCPLPFPAQAINVAPDGTIYVGGEGRVAKLSTALAVLAAADSPQMSDMPPLPPPPDPSAKPAEDEAAKQAREAKVAELREKTQAVQKEYIAAAREMQAAKDDAQRREALQQKYNAVVQRYVAMSRELREAQMTPEAIAQQKRQMALASATVNGIAVSPQDVFVCCRATEGYTFDVWRTDRDFQGAKKIVTGLRGCCGQMDIQTCGGDLWVAENAHHRVSHYDRDGKLIKHFGKYDRTAVDGFGGCCEPKNLRFTAGGELITCQSGPPILIQRWSQAGDFLGLVGEPKYETGCVRVTVAISKDGNRVYVLNPGQNRIEVLAKGSSEAKQPLTSLTPEPRR